MRRVIGVVFFVMVLLVATLSWAASVFEVTQDMQEKITWQIWGAQGWAASPIVVEAVLAQNVKKPIPGMDNAKWKTMPESDAIVQGFMNNEAAKFLKEEIAKTEGMCTGASLHAASGENVAFTDKTGSYIQKGSAEFDMPFTSGKAWQGKPELNESRKVTEIQISVPVLSEGKPVGVLVIGINGAKL